MGNLQKILPNSSNKKQDDNLRYVLYIWMVKWGKSLEEFRETPMIILQALLKEYELEKKKEAKANKKK